MPATNVSIPGPEPSGHKPAIEAVQAGKSYADDIKKAEAHDRIGQVIDETLLMSKRPEELRAIHLPGIDAQETRVVYLSRGILPENITGVEKDSDIIEKIRRHGLGIALENCFIESYVKKYALDRISFDIISLDFNGPINTELVRTFRELVSLTDKDELVLHTANLLQRETASSKKEYSIGFGLSGFLEEARNGDSLVSPLSIMQFCRDLESKYESNGQRYDMESKTAYYPYAILNALISRPSYHYPIARFLYGDRLGRLEQDLIDSTQPNVPVGVGIEQLLLNYSDSRLLSGLDRRMSLMLLTHLGMSMIDNVSASVVMSSLLEASCPSAPLLPRASRHYTYISESGASMIGSIFHLSRATGLHTAALSLAESLGFPDGFMVADRDIFIKTYNNYLDELGGISRSMSEPLLVEYLGGSPKSIMTREMLYAALDNNEDIEELKANTRGWRTKIIGWLADYMDNLSESRETPASEPSASNADNGKSRLNIRDILGNTEDESKGITAIDSITREDAISLLQSGIPPEEIAAAFPGSFSLKQLRSFKAHVTMGTYEKKGNRDTDPIDEIAPLARE